jgi:Uncharacterized protein with conserved CXXC pairs
MTITKSNLTATTQSMICVVCPLGCEMTVSVVSDEYQITGNKCPRGLKYAKEELASPKRMVTTTVKVVSDDGNSFLLPVKTLNPVPKDQVFEVVAALKKITLKHSLAMGEVVLKNILDTGVDIVAC